MKIIVWIQSPDIRRYEEQDGYCSPVTEHDLAVNGPVEPKNYAEEMLLN